MAGLNKEILRYMATDKLVHHHHHQHHLKPQTYMGRDAEEWKHSASSSLSGKCGIVNLIS